MYDKDGSGCIDKTELKEIVEVCFVVVEMDVLRCDLGGG